VVHPGPTGLPVPAAAVSMRSECRSSTACSVPGGGGAVPEGRALVLWRCLLPHRALAAVVSTAPCRLLAGCCWGALLIICVASLSQSKVFSTKQWHEIGAPGLSLLWADPSSFCSAQPVLTATKTGCRRGGGSRCGRRAALGSSKALGRR